MKRVGLVLLSTACLLSGCEKISQLPIYQSIFGQTLQCHDPDVQQTLVGIISDQAHIAVGEHRQVYDSYVVHNPLTLSTIVEDSRSAEGAVSCSASLDENLPDKAAFEAFVRQQAATYSQFSGMLPQIADNERQAEAVLESAPSSGAKGIGSWNIHYKVSFTSDRSQVIVSVGNAAGIGNYLGLYALAEGGGHMASKTESQSAPALQDRAVDNQSPTSSQSAINLNSIRDFETAGSEHLHTITGRCGDADITATDITLSSDEESFAAVEDSSALTVRKNGITISFINNLSEFNKLRCVNSKMGARLVLATLCGGSSCGENYYYEIFDPNALPVPPGDTATARYKFVPSIGNASNLRDLDRLLGVKVDF